MSENRYFRIIYYLLENGKVSAKTLADEFEVSIRTIYRDIDVISSAGIPIYVTTGRNGGIQIADHYKLKNSYLCDEEKKELLAILQSFALVDQSYETSLLNKLSALFKITTQDWVEVDFSRWGGKKQDIVHFEQLKKAVLHHIAIEICYINTLNEQTKRKIYPLKLLYKSKEWYLKAFCTQKQSFRTFKLNRILELTLLNETFQPMTYPNEDLIPPLTQEIHLIFSEKAAYRIVDEFDSENIKRLKDGSFFVHCKLPADDWLIGYLLSFGDDVRIIHPTWLIEEIKQKTTQILKQYA